MTFSLQDIKNFSKPFKIAFFSLFIIYFLFWLFSIHLAGVQKEQGLKPLLPVLYQDSHEYADLAQNMLQKHAFTQVGEETETFRAPGYPAFVAFSYTFFQSYFLVTLLQIILVFGSALVIRRLGMRFFSTQVGEIAGIIFLCSPIILTLSLVILTDTLFLFLFVLGFYVASGLRADGSSRSKIIKVLLASLLFAGAIYVRPMGEFALPLFALPFLLSDISWKKRLQSIVLMVAIVVLCVLPWMFRNYRLTGVFEFTSFKAGNLALVVVPNYVSHVNNTTPEQEIINFEKETGVPQTQWRNLTYSKILTQSAEKIILAHPFNYLIYHTMSSLPFFFSSSIQDMLYVYHSSMSIPEVVPPSAIQFLIRHDWGMFFKSLLAVWWKIVERMALVFIYLVALLAVYVHRKRLVVWVCLIIPLYLGILSGEAANVRYAIQALPFILLLFAVGMVDLKTKGIQNSLIKHFSGTLRKQLENNDENEVSLEH